MQIQHEMARQLIYESTELGPTTQNRLLQAIEWVLDISIVKARAMMRFSSMNVNRCGRLKTIEVGKREMALKLQSSSLHSFPFQVFHSSYGSKGPAPRSRLTRV